MCIMISREWIALTIAWDILANQDTNAYIKIQIPCSDINENTNCQVEKDVAP